MLNHLLRITRGFSLELFLSILVVGQFKIGGAGTTSCPNGYELVTDKENCEKEAVIFFNKSLHAAGCWEFGTAGCVYKTEGIFFNTCANPPTIQEHAPICKIAGQNDISGKMRVLSHFLVIHRAKLK